MGPCSEASSEITRTTLNLFPFSLWRCNFITWTTHFDIFIILHTHNYIYSATKQYMPQALVYTNVSTTRCIVCTCIVIGPHTIFLHRYNPNQTILQNAFQICFLVIIYILMLIKPNKGHWWKCSHCTIHIFMCTTYSSGSVSIMKNLSYNFLCVSKGLLCRHFLSTQVTGLLADSWRPKMDNKLLQKAKIIKQKPEKHNPVIYWGVWHQKIWHSADIIADILYLS